MKKAVSAIAVLATVLLTVAGTTQHTRASSHREALAILNDPCVDNTDCASGLCISNPGYCSRFCNAAPCPSNLPHCQAAGVKADGVSLQACTK